METRKNVTYYDAQENAFHPGVLLQGADGWRLCPADEAWRDEGLYASPGWIDMHTHIFDGVGLFGTRADDIGLDTGVCMLVDAGTVGEFTFDGFARYVSPTIQTPHKLFLCISPIGVIFHHDYNAMQYLDSTRTAAFIAQHRDCIAGVKVRMGSETIRHEGLAPLRLAAEAAHGAGVPMMVHVGGNPPYLKDMAQYFERGDILTHVFNGRGGDVWNKDGTPGEGLACLLEKGVLLDVGHGSSSFDFDVFERAQRHALPPLLMGTDLHQSSVKRLVRNMGVMLSKLYGCGMRLEDILYGATKASADALGLSDWCDRKTLQTATLFRIEDKRATYEDCQGNTRTFEKAVCPVAVITGGALRPCAQAKE